VKAFQSFIKAADEDRFTPIRPRSSIGVNRRSSVALILELLIDHEEYGQAGCLVLVGYDGGALTGYRAMGEQKENTTSATEPNSENTTHRHTLGGYDDAVGTRHKRQFTMS
jgi:hypothetical protein